MCTSCDVCSDGNTVVADCGNVVMGATAACGDVVGLLYKLWILGEKADLVEADVAEEVNMNNVETVAPTDPLGTIGPSEDVATMTPSLGGTLAVTEETDMSSQVSESLTTLSIVIHQGDE